ncbi:MAG TPA: MFS transporter [Solirubrobacteraceae bacterium]|nr:MFS transporter [Solirubrobacteraceae bacterium]
MSCAHTPQPPGTPERLWAPARRALTVGLILTNTLIACESLAVLTIMPRVARDLGGLSLYGWVFSVFMLGSIVGTVAAGRASDRVGPARPFLAGLALFTAGLALAGLAPTMGVLVLARAVQGLGAGAAPAICYVVIGRALPEHLRPRMLALLSSAWVLPGLMGPALSAEVTRVFGWRWVFIGLIPLVALAGALSTQALRRLGRPAVAAGAATAVEHRLRDALRVALGAAMLLGGFSARSLPLAALLVLGGLVVGVPALRALLPDGTLSARPGLPAVVLSRGLLMFAFLGGDAFVTLTITTVLHHSTALASLVVTTATLSWTAGDWLQVRLSARRQGRGLVRVGLLLLLAGIAGMLLVAQRPQVGVAEAIIAWTVAGLGTGLAYSPTSLMTMREASAGNVGWASASLNLAEVLGTALGAGLGGAAIVLANHRGWQLSTAVTLAFAIAAAGAVLALALARRLPRTPRPPVQEAGAFASGGVAV